MFENSVFNEIKEVFEDYYGEENVECTIHENSLVTVVHWDELEVENETGNKCKIYDLFVKTKFTDEGKLYESFMALRTTYTRKQYDSGYIHSHIPRYNMGTWKTMCLGRGPLSHTRSIMYNSYDIDTIKLYCLELDKMVRVESLSGGPYIRMAEIGSSTQKSIHYNDVLNYGMSEYATLPINFFEFKIYAEMLKDVYKDICSLDGTHCISVDLNDFAVQFTKMFIKHRFTDKNIPLTKETLSELTRCGILLPCFVKYNRIELIDNGSSRNSIMERDIHVTFKGNTYSLKIIEEDIEENTKYILSPKIVMEMLNYINNTSY